MENKYKTDKNLTHYLQAVEKSTSETFFIPVVFGLLHFTELKSSLETQSQLKSKLQTFIIWLFEWNLIMMNVLKISSKKLYGHYTSFIPVNNGLNNSIKKLHIVYLSICRFDIFTKLHIDNVSICKIDRFFENLQ